MNHLFLFDIDGVLVDARGYLKALQDTVTHFSHSMGLGDHAPTEKQVRVFEANGLTSEWDSGAACVAALLVERLRQEPSLPLSSRWPDVLSTLAAHPRLIPPPDYPTLAQQVGERVSEGQTVAQAARAILREEALAIPGLGSLSSEVAVLLDALLGHTHDFYRAPVTRHFQHLAIGSQAVAETYGIYPDFESPAYLERFDRPLLAPSVLQGLEEAVASGHLGVALYTARPSLPPLETDEPMAGYSPEAEMARSLVGLETWPTIGLGKVRWLARQAGEKVERLVKPSPVQALAAVGAAWSGQEAAALRAALVLHRKGELYPPLADLEPVTVHVFEDAVGGLAATQRGVEALQAAGLTVAVRLYGIALAGGPKATAMVTQEMPVYPSVNEAALAALALIGQESRSAAVE